MLSYVGSLYCFSLLRVLSIMQTCGLDGQQPPCNREIRDRKKAKDGRQTCGERLPESLRAWRSRHPALHRLLFIAGDE